MLFVSAAVQPAAYAQQPGVTPSLRHDVPDADLYKTVLAPAGKVDDALERAGLLTTRRPASSKVEMWMERTTPKKVVSPITARRRGEPISPMVYPEPEPAMQLQDAMAPVEAPSPLFPGLKFTDNPTYADGFLFIPADPWGAVGNNHVCHVVNVAIDCIDKVTGAHAAGFPTGLATFFAPLNPLTATFDPKIIYDQAKGRFVVITLETTEQAFGDSLNTSRILMAASVGNDPAGGWNFQAIDAARQVGGINHWFDYPNIGLDEDAIYITGNLFNFADQPSNYGGVSLYIIRKAQLYNGKTAVVRHFHPFDEIEQPQFAMTVQPAIVYGEPGSPATGTEVGTFLVGYNGLSNGNEFLITIEVDDPLTTPSFDWFLTAMGNIEPSTGPMNDARQLDDGAAIPPLPIETNDRRTLNSVWRNGTLHTVHQIQPGTGADAGQTTAHWVALSTATGALVDQANIGGEDIAPNTTTFFPAVAVNALNDVVVGFSASAPSIFAGSYYVGRRSSDPAGTFGPAGTLKAGEASYRRTFSTTSGRNRWGDYSSVSVDPVDEEKFWVVNKSADTRGTTTGGTTTTPEDGRWEVYVGRVSLAPLVRTITVTQPNASSVWQAGTTQTITWDSSNLPPTSSVRVRYRQGTGSFTDIVTSTPNDGSHSWTLPAGLTPANNYWVRVQSNDFPGVFDVSEKFTVTAAAGAARVVADGVPYGLDAARPNPFNPTTTMTLAVEAAQHVRVEVFDLLGRQVALLHDGTMDAHQAYTLRFDASALPSGLYLVRAAGETFQQTQRVTLMK